MSRSCVCVFLAIGIGVLVTAGTAAASFALSKHGSESISQVVFWPNTLLQALIPAPNIGTSDHRLREGTPFNFFAFLASFPLAVTLYTFVAYMFLRRLKT